MNYVAATESVERGEFDMAIGGMRANAISYNNVRFSYPTYNTGLQLVVVKKPHPTFWLLFEPFDPRLWAALVITSLIMAHIMWILERGNDGEFPLEYGKGMKEALWHSFASFFFTGDKEIRTIPGRIMQVSYWFMAFVLFAAYTANLTTRLSFPIDDTKIKDYKDIDGKEVGALTFDRNILSEYGCDVSSFLMDDLDG